MVKEVKSNAPGGKLYKSKPNAPGGIGTKNKRIQQVALGLANIDVGKIGEREKKLLEKRLKNKKSNADIAKHLKKIRRDVSDKMKQRKPISLNNSGGPSGTTPYQKAVKGFSNASNKITKLTTRILTGPVLGVGKFVTKPLYDKYLRDKERLKKLNKTISSSNSLELKPYRQDRTRNKK